MVSVERDFSDAKWPFGGEGGLDDVPVPTGVACTKISEILALADEYAGEYSFGGQADTLPSNPGLCIDGVGMIALPLVQEQAGKLIEKCEMSPFGHNMETKTDESVRRSWQLQPDQVQLKNPQWENGLAELTKLIANRLCYKGVPMECKVYKLLVYGEGGHFLKHQDTEKENGMVATLVVQLPSLHEGGDLVVYRGGQEQHRYDFGKADGTAAFFPQFAVHYADAEHALETVTKGYRLALVFSVCLPAMMRELERDPNRTIAEDLAEVINTMGPDNESFALFLSHEYTKKSIGDLGSAALKGIDSARFRALEGANAAVQTDKRLQFFIVKLSHKVNRRLDEEGWANWDSEQGSHWYSMSGEDLGHNKDGRLKTELNFLNPGKETFLQLWEPHGSSDDVYTGNEGPMKSTKYSRFAIVAWPASKHAEYALEFMSAECTIELLLSQRPVGAVTLRAFLHTTSRKHSNGRHVVRFCRSLCELLVDAGDPELAKMFFSKYCPRLGYLTENATLLPGLIKIIRMCEWNKISKDVLIALGDRTGEYGFVHNRGESGLEMTLHVVGGLEDKAAQQDLLKMVMEKDLDLRTSEAVELLWEYIIRPGGDQTFKDVVNKLTKKDPKTLGPFLEVFYEHLHDLETNDEASSVLASLTEKRIGWLKERIERLEQPFSWEMPDAQFNEYDEIEFFLKGPRSSMSTEKERVPTFSNVAEARKFATTSMRDLQYESSFMMEPAGNEYKPFVIITKTRKWFEDAQKKVLQYKVELECLAKLYRSPAKKARIE